MKRKLGILFVVMMVLTMLVACGGESSDISDDANDKVVVEGENQGADDSVPTEENQTSTTETAPEVVPETTPEETPETTPESMPETTPEQTPETKPEVAPDTETIPEKEYLLEGTYWLQEHKIEIYGNSYINASGFYFDGNGKIINVDNIRVKEEYYDHVEEVPGEDQN